MRFRWKDLGLKPSTILCQGVLETWKFQVTGLPDTSQHPYPIGFIYTNSMG